MQQSNRQRGSSLLSSAHVDQLPFSRWQVQELHQKVQPGLVPLVGHAEDPAEIRQRLLDVELAEEGQFLRHVAHPGSRDSGLAVGTGGVAEDDYGARVHLQLAHDAFQKGRFSTARGT